MSVHAKAPRIDVRISGPGARKVADLIRKIFKDARIELGTGKPVGVFETEWYKGIAAGLTPGRALHVYRDNAGMTLADIAEKTGIAVSHLSAMENGKRNIGKASAQKLGKALKCEYRRFL
jgi:DNA-binding XRE family transcriptional regulator